MMSTFTVVTLFLSISLFIPLSSAEHCRDLSGPWYNQLGSEMILRHSVDGLLYGEYRTGVERKPGSAGTTHSIVIGAAPYDTPSATFGMAIMWRNGSSTTAWTGQCLVCEESGNETLVTSWLLRSTVDTCTDKWKSTMIGRDFFTRDDLVMGPRKDEDTHTPSDGYSPPSYGGDTSGGSNIVKRETGDATPPCVLDGFWYNQQGSQIHLEHKDDGTLIGEYRTAVETKEGAAGSSHSMIFGIANPSDNGKTWAMFVVWNKGASITGWVGQCHVCGSNSVEVLETGWLLRSQADHCSESWKSTLYGESSFTRERPAVSAFNTPGEAGEDDQDDVVKSNPCNDALSLRAGMLPVLLWALLLTQIYLV